ncbi:unnamed protein product [Meganyctiphanes norvegica]|uniref:Vitellogenin domain-containing protein n=1 Tax=Meganyctiphanes norvegica TaxID=48144 RepID=A0AAV2Q4X4_MEGNR
MDFTAVLWICLIAGVFGDSQTQDFPNLRCSEECHMTSNTKLSYELGATYRYKYSGISMVNITGLEQGRISSEFSANVDFTWLNPCDVLMLVKDVNADGAESQMMNTYPTVVSFIDGTLDKICIHPKDDADSVNMKRGIASYMQNTLPELTPSPLSQILQEEDIIGECPTAYTVEASGETTVVTKERDHNRCTNNHMQVLNIPLMKTHLKLYSSKSICKQEIANGIYINIWCKDTNAVDPIRGFKDLTSATAEASLKFDSKDTDSNNLQSLSDITLVRSHLTYDFRVSKNANIVNDIGHTLSNICALIQSQGLPEVTSSVAKVIGLLRQAPSHVIVETLQKIRRREFCPNFKKLESIFLDVIVYIGKNGAVKIMAEEIAANRVSGGRLPMYAAAFHLLNDPSEDTIMALTPILLMTNPDPTAILSTGTVINKYCNKHSNCMESVSMKYIMNIISKKLQTQCTLEFSTENPKEVLGSLKALANIGTMPPEVAENVLKCVQLQEMKPNIRFTAAMVLKGAPCLNSVKNTLLDLVFDPLINSEIRIASYLARMNCISEGDIDHILTEVTHIANKDVYSFIISHLLNLKKTDWPTKHYLHDLLSSKNIPLLHQRNILKQSQNLQMSYNIPNIGSGIELESNIIRSKNTYIPKFMSLDFNMNLMGSAFNFGEIGTMIDSSDVSFEDREHQSYLSTMNFNGIIDEFIDYMKNDGKYALIEMETKNDNRLLSSILKHVSSLKIPLPKTELYAKIFNQELFFFSLFGDKKEIKTSELVQVLILAIKDTLDSIKDVDIDTARAGQIQLHHVIPTIQGLPLIISAEATVLANVALKSNYNAKDGKFEGNLKFAPSFSLQIDGFIGYGQNIKNGIKMKTVIYTTNGLSIKLQMRDGQVLDMNMNLPDKMELLNIKSEVYPIKSTQKGQQLKGLVTDLQDVRFARDQCLGVIESFTGLNICYKINIPSMISQNGISLAKPVLLKLFLQKSNESMRGYQVTSRFKNTNSATTLKMNIGLTGVSIPREVNIKLSHTTQQDNDVSILNLDFHSSLLKCLLEVTTTDKEEQTSLLFFGNVQVETSRGEKGVSGVLRTEVNRKYRQQEQQYEIALYTALSKTLENERKICYIEALFGHTGETTKAKFSTNIDPLAMSLNTKAEFKTQSIPGFWIPKIITVGNVDIAASLGNVRIESKVIMASDAAYQSSFTLLYKENIIFALTGAHYINGDIRNFIFDTFVGVRIGSSEWSSTTYFTYDYADHMEALTKLVRPDNSRVFYIKIKYDKNGNTQKMNMEVYIPGVIESTKASFYLANIDSYSSIMSMQPVHSFNLKTKILRGKSVYLQVEGPIAIELSPEKIMHDLDFKISGSAAFHGPHNFMHNLTLTPDKFQFMIDLKKELSHLFTFNLHMEKDDLAHSFQIDIYLPNYVKNVIGAQVTSMSAEVFLDTIILPDEEPDTGVDPNVDYQSLQNTVSSRRVKGNAHFNIESHEFKGELYWDVENDKEKKMSVFTSYNYDDIDHHVTINGDLLIFSETYSYKIDSVLGSPFNWFKGDNGIELFITLPTDAVFTWKAKCKVVIEDSTVTLKPLLFVQLMDSEKFNLTGLLVLTNLKQLHNLEIISEWNLSLPGIEKIKLTNRYIQQISDDSYKSVFKTSLGESVLNNRIEFDIISDSKPEKYSNIVKIKFGSLPTEIVASIAGSSQVTDASITVKPLGSANSLTVKLAKTSQSINLAILKNKQIYTNIKFIMDSNTSYVFILQLPSRTIKSQIMVSEGKLIMDIYPEITKSDRKLEVKIMPTLIAGVAHLETHISASSMQNDIDVNAEYAISKSMENIIDFDMNYPIQDIKNLTSIIKKELETIYQELKTEGVFTDLNMIFSKLKNTIKDIPTSLKPYIKKLRISSVNIFKKIQEGITNIYKIYETDFALLLKQFLSDIDSYLNIAEENIILITKPVIHFIKNSDVLQRISERIDVLSTDYPVTYDIIIDFYDKVIQTNLNDINTLYTKMKNVPTNDIRKVLKELKIELYLIFQHFQEQLLDSKLVNMIQTNIDYLIEQYPLFYETSVNLLSKNKEILQENINVAYEKIMHTVALEKMDISSIFTRILKIIKDNISWKSILDALRSFIKENLGFVYSISDDHIKAHLQLPISVSSLYSTWEFVFYKFPAFLTDITNDIHTFIKENVLLYMYYIGEEAPHYITIIVKYLITATNITLSIMDHLSQLLVDTETFQTLKAKLQELVENYPTEIIEAFFNWTIASVNEYSMWLINDIADIPFVYKALKYIENNLMKPFVKFIFKLLHTHEPVRVHLYYEAMCPFCKQFNVEQLYPTWKELGDIMEVELFPFGNAKYEPSGSGWKFTCQHGPDECIANMIMACAKDKLRDINIEMDFVHCLESAEQPAHAGRNCSVTVGVAWDPIETCINSLEGQILLHDVALRQEKLIPKVKYVPWILINDHWSEELEDASTSNLKKVVCEFYGGTRPECNKVQPLKLQLQSNRRTYP